MEFFEGTCFLIAGPGSGKTFTVTNRVRYLVEQRGIPEKEILVVTFTRAAAVEMRQRYLSMIARESTSTIFCTFHSLFFNMLKSAYGRELCVVANEETKRKLLQDIVSKKKRERPDFLEDCTDGNDEEFYDSVLSEMSVIKNKEIDESNYYPKCCGEDEFRFLLEEYKKGLRRGGYIDFDDMQLFVLELLEQRKDIRKMYQDRFRFILIDEFQDINNLQYRIMKLIGGDEPNIFAVGDDDQSIYSFRGADPGITFRFVKDYRGTKTIPLDVNYRSTPSIVGLSSRVIRHNKKRFKKNLRANTLEDNPVSYRVFDNEYVEAESITRDIEELIAKGVEPGQIAVLFRNNNQSFLYRRRLGEKNIPYSVKSGKTDENVDGVILSTIHASKGLEYEAVFLPQLNENYIPYRKARLIRDLDEERRLMYVAMTRAKRYLSLSSDRTIHGKKTAVSLFIKESGLIRLNNRR